MRYIIVISFFSILLAILITFYNSPFYINPIKKTETPKELPHKISKKSEASNEITTRENLKSNNSLLPNQLYTRSDMDNQEILKASEILNISINEIHPIQINNEYIEELKIDETLSINIPNLGTIDYTIEKINKGKVNYMSGYLFSDPSRMQEVYITWKDNSFFGSILTHHGRFDITTINDKQYLFFGTQETID